MQHQLLHANGKCWLFWDFFCAGGLPNDKIAIAQDGMKEKLAADSKKTPPLDSGNEASSEDSNDSNSRESKENSGGASKDGQIMAATSSTAEISSLIGLVTAGAEWTGSDQSMFRAIHKIYLSNYCVIAQVMLTKTCQQVRWCGGVLIPMD